MSEKLWIFAPCYFDSDSFLELRKRIYATTGEQLPNLEVCFVVVDDSAGQDPYFKNDTDHKLKLSTPYNLGHQGALVYGLRTMASEIADTDYVITMDCDGEDRPEDIPTLIAPLLQSDELGRVSVARRTKRNEGLKFRAMLFIFQRIFFILTGLVVRSGNFVAFRGWFARHSLLHPYFDYCYSSSVLAVSRKCQFVPLPRGKRYAGQSKMSFLDLAAHGFTMLLPFSERIAFRAFLLYFTFMLIWAAALVLRMVAHNENVVARLAVVSELFLGLSLILVVVWAVFLLIGSRARLLKLRKQTGGKDF